MNSCNNRFPTEEDKFIVKELVKAGLSYAEIERKTGFKWTTVKRWTDPEFAKKIAEYAANYQKNRLATDPEFRRKQNERQRERFKFRYAHCPAFKQKQKQMGKDRTRLRQDWQLSCILNGYEPFVDFCRRCKDI